MILPINTSNGGRMSLVTDVFRNHLQVRSIRDYYKHTLNVTKHLHKFMDTHTVTIRFVFLGVHYRVF